MVGAGQSAAETVNFLYRRFPDAEVCAVFARYGYSPASDSSFTTRVDDPGAVDEFFRAQAEVKDLILGYHTNTNYSVVDPDLVNALYRRHYHEKVSGRERLRMLNVSRVAGAVEVNGRVELAVESMVTSRREVLTADLVVYATGYQPSDPGLPAWRAGRTMPPGQRNLRAGSNRAHAGSPRRCCPTSQCAAARSSHRS